MKLTNPIHLFLSSILLSTILIGSACDEQIPRGIPSEALKSGEVRFNILDEVNSDSKILNSISAYNKTYNKIILPHMITTKFNIDITKGHYVTDDGMIISNGKSGAIFKGDILNLMKDSNLNNFLALDENVTVGDSLDVFYPVGVTSASNRFIVITDAYGNSTQTVQALDSVGHTVGDIITAGTIQDQNRTTEYISTGTSVNVGRASQPLYAAVYPLTALLPPNKKIYGLRITQKDSGDGSDGKVVIILDENYLQCTVVANNDDFETTPLEIGELSPSIFADNGNGTDKSNLSVDAVDSDISDIITFSFLDGLSPTMKITSNGEIEIPKDTQSGIYNPIYKICLEKDVAYCDTATAKLLVNNKPIVVDDVDNTDQGLSMFVDVLANDSHFDINETLKLISVKGSQNSVVEVNGTKVLYTPNIGFIGEDTFTYMVEDVKGNQVEGSAIITVKAAPSLSIEDASAIEGSFLAFKVTLSNLYRADMRVSFEIEDITTLPSDYNETSNRGYLDIPAGELSGIYRMMITNDLIDEKDEALKLKIKKVSTEIGDISSIAIGKIVDNDTSPKAVDDFKSARTGKKILVATLLNDIAGTAAIDRTKVKILDGNDTVSNLVIPGAGEWKVDDENGTISFTPEKDYIGDPASIEYSISDIGGNTDKANISVNYPPVAFDDEGIAKVNDSLLIDVLSNDKSTSHPIDINSLQLVNGINKSVDTIYVEGKGSFNVNKTEGTIEFVPDNNFVGEVIGKYRVSETNGDISNIATITIAYPKLTDDIIKNVLGGKNSSIDVLKNDGENINPSSVKLIGAKSSGVLVVAGEGEWSLSGSVVTFSPEDGFLKNPTSIKYKASYKNVYLNPANISIMYNAGKMYARDDLGIVIDKDETKINVILNDSYGAYGPGEEKIASTDPKHGRVIINDNGTSDDLSDDTLTYKVDKEDYIGTDTFSYTITDLRGDTATATVTLNITKSISQSEDSGEINKLLFLLLFPLLLLVRRKENI